MHVSRFWFDVVAFVEEYLVSVFCTSSSQVEAKEQKDLAPLSHLNICVAG